MFVTIFIFCIDSCSVLFYLLILNLLEISKLFKYKEESFNILKC